jgi:hypothetical protein
MHDLQQHCTFSLPYYTDREGYTLREVSLSPSAVIKVETIAPFLMINGGYCIYQGFRGQGCGSFAYIAFGAAQMGISCTLLYCLSLC